MERLRKRRSEPSHTQNAGVFKKLDGGKMRRHEPIVYDPAKTGETSPGATLEADEIERRLEKGEIKLKDLPMQTRDSYRNFVRNYKRARFNGDI